MAVWQRGSRWMRSGHLGTEADRATFRTIHTASAVLTDVSDVLAWDGAFEHHREHARELLLEFADFTRYSFRRHGEFTTLADELRSIERYLVLEKARFGDRLHLTLRVAPEVLPVTVPFLCLQPLVENAVRHGLEARPAGVATTMVRLHTPESIPLDQGRLPG